MAARRALPPFPLVVALAVAPLACDRDRPAVSSNLPTSSASVPPSTPLTAASATAPPALEPRRLALQDPAGATPADRDLRALVQRATRTDFDPDAWVLLGHAWVRKARRASDLRLYRNADAAAALALERDPRHRPALGLRALILLQQRRFTDARDLAEQLLATDPDDALALDTLSDTLLELGRFDDAVRAAQRRVDLKPDLGAYARVAHLRWLRGDIVGAKQIFRLAMNAYDPAEPEPYAWVLVQAAMLFWHEGDLEGADRGFDRALDASSDYPPALLGKARVALAQRDTSRAISLLDRAVARSATPEALFLLADAHHLAGPFKAPSAPATPDAAARAQTAAIDAARQSDPRALALFLADRDPAEALHLIEAERAHRGGSGDLYTEDAYAWILHRAGRLPEARAASDRARTLGTRDARLLYHAGAIHLAAGEHADASRLLQAALRQNPHFDPAGAADAARLLAQARSPDASAP
ncbi:tetratricopeptide repeat protein [Chondromyces crocatus]|uniref:Tetratricopeptide repeat protein n=1 Tax=Chondromyces crocatus TaxID=52 RepID=A0A0K1ES24_CHOCO|nr:tetratricopeptide repeat protein [Chondromyces crocatus]AKT43423.1 uncharacterized protein CMC5_076550 [Chondromyces crocatus]